MMNLALIIILTLIILIALRKFLQLNIIKLISYFFSIFLLGVLFIAEIKFLDTNPYGYLFIMSFYPFYFYILLNDKRTSAFVKRLLLQLVRFIRNFLS